MIKNLFIVVFAVGLVLGCSDGKKTDTTPNKDTKTDKNNNNSQKSEVEKLGKNSDLCKGENCPGYVH
ncbi:MAG: hypothetical protein PF689_03595 [Deltaproteobacteria bacterium]|jgi:hypothetical protein|nr:hypothetical protein [Deltaproteobacteria bacterium]